MLKRSTLTLMLSLFVSLLLTAQVNEITLTFSPVSGGNDVIATATDAGSGLQADGPINLVESTEYTLSIELGDANTSYQSQSDSIQFFFQAADGLLQSDVAYSDADGNGLPVGFASTWTSVCLDAEATGTIRIALQDLGENKSSGSTINDGTSVFDVTWDATVSNDPDAPACENEEEIITDVVLTFTPMDGGDPVVARAQDPDGEGVLPLQILDDINLLESTEYTMDIAVSNEIEGEDITQEIREEDEEHMFFFAFTEGIFADPQGDGNVDNRADVVNYNDFDSNNQPVGLSTSWTTAESMNSGTLRIVLKHQPDIKSMTSTVDDGGTDIDLTWNVNTTVTSTQTVRAGQDTDFQIAPNPVHSQLFWTWNTPQQVQQQEVRIVDQTGRVMQRRLTPDRTILDVSNLPQGVYFLQIQSANEIQTRRFIKVD